jgi:hypothetical protein
MAQGAASQPVATPSYEGSGFGIEQRISMAPPAIPQHLF